MEHKRITVNNTEPLGPKKHTNDLAVLLSIPILVLGMILGVGLGYLLWGDTELDATPEAESTKTVNAEPNEDPQAQDTPVPVESPDVSSDYGYRGGESGVKLTEHPDTVAKNVMDSLELTREQTGQYPSDFTEYQRQIIWKYGYNSMSAGPHLKCPADNGHFSYSAFKDQRSASYTSYDLYYCKGTTVVHKSSADNT